MNIVFYYHLDILPEMGGTERATYALAQELATRNIRSIFLAHARHDCNPTGNTTEFLQKYLPNSSVLDCPENEEYIHSLCQNEEVDVFINQDVMNQETLFFSKLRFPEIKLIGICHFSLYGGIHHFEDYFKQRYILGHSSLWKYLIQRLLTPLYKYRLRNMQHCFLKQIYESNDRIVLMSEQEKRYYPVVDRSRLVSIPNPVTLKRRVDCACIKEKLILVVSRMVYVYKRIDYFLQIWKRLESLFPDWKVNILGDGACRSYYSNLSKKLKLQHVSFCGRVIPDDFYARASIICSTSTNEGFGLTLTEGMAHGCVPIAFNSFSTARDIIDHEKNGFLISPYNIEEYTSKLKCIMADGSLLTSMSKQAEAKVKEFAPHCIGEKWCRILSEI